MKILIVCGVLPPKVSATALLLDKLLPFFGASGFEVSGLTVKSGFADADRYSYGAMTVYRADCVFHSPLSVECPKDFVYKAVNRIKRTFFKPKTPGTVKKRDVVRALVDKMRRVSAHSYDCILAVCAYYDAAEAVARYKKRYAPKTPILLYQVDPLAENITYGGADSLLAYERDLYTTYDHVFTTPTVYKQKQKLGWDLSNVSTLMFPADFDEKKECPREEREEIRCVYAGQLYGGLRDATYTLELFSAITDPRVHLYFVGKGQEELLREYENGKLRGRLHVLGIKTTEECDRILAEADVLVNIGNTDKYFIPSKLFHYFGFGKPIVNVIADRECPGLPFASQYGLSVNVSVDEDFSANVEKTERWIAEHYKENVSIRDVSERFRECSPEYIAQTIIDTIHGVKHE